MEAGGVALAHGVVLRDRPRRGEMASHGDVGDVDAASPGVVRQAGFDDTGVHNAGGLRVYVRYGNS